MRGRVYTYWPGGGDRLRYNACNSAIVVVGIYVAMDYNQTSEVMVQSGHASDSSRTSARRSMDIESQACIVCMHMREQSPDMHMCAVVMNIRA